MTTEKEKEKENERLIDYGYVNKTIEEQAVICHEVIALLQASKIKPSQGIDVIWSALKGMYSAWMLLGGPQDNALNHLRQYYEETKRVIVTKSPWTEIQDDN